MREQFVPFEIALKLKEKGFDQQCLAYYNTDPYLKIPVFNLTKPFEHEWVLPTPLWQQVIDWLREKHSIMICVDFYNEGSEKEPHIIYHFKISEPKTWHYCDIIVKSDYKTYPEARQVAIENALTLI